MAIPGERKVDISKAFAEGTLIDEAMNEAVREAVELHRRLGLPLVVWRNGRTAWVMADDPETEVPDPGLATRKNL